VIWPIL